MAWIIAGKCGKNSLYIKTSGIITFVINVTADFNVSQQNGVST